jgi:flagellar hook-associated protein 3 FlgL
MLTYLPQFLSQHLVAVGLVAAVLGLAWFVFRLYRRWNLVFGRNAKTSEQLGAEFGKRLAAAEAQVSTGLRVARPSQDLVSWGEGKRAEARRIASDARAGNIARAKERLADVERIFAGLGQSLDRARQLAVMGANATTSAADRAILAEEIRSIRAGALQLVNTRDAFGQYVLSGSASDTTPFDPTTGAWQGNNTALSIEVGEGANRVVSVSGEVLTATFGVDLFATLQSAVDALDANDVPALQVALGDLGTALGQVVDARAGEVGVRMTALADADRAREELDLSLTELLSRARDADVIAAASGMANGMNALEAARTVAERIVQLMRAA